MKIEQKKMVLGVFVLGGILLGVFFVLFLGGGHFFHRTQKFILFFDTSVKGLNVGSQVLFRGVKVGQVTDIQLRADPEDMNIEIPVIIELRPDQVVWTGEALQPKTIYEALLKQGLRAQLLLQSFVTGSCMVELDFFPEAEPREISYTGKYPEIPTIASSFQELTATVEQLPLDDLVNKLIASLEGIEKTINSPAIPSTLTSMDQTMQDLRNAVRGLDTRIPSLTRSLEDTLQDIQDLIQHLDEQIALAGAGFNATRKQTEQVAASLDTEIKTVSSEIQQTTHTIQKTFQEIQKSLSLKKSGALSRLLASLEKTFTAARSTLQQTEKSLASLQEATDEDSALRFQMTNTLKELTGAARSVRNLTDYLERHPEALFKGKQRY